MHAVSRQYHPFYQCINDPTYEDYIANGSVPNGCGYQTFSVIFFVSFAITISLVFINLFVAIILEGFDETIVENKQPFNI